MKGVELREDEYVCIRKDEYDRLLDSETRIDVLVDLLEADKHVDVELELRILGTELAITTANEMKVERERAYEAYKNGSPELHGVSGSGD